MKCKKFDDCIQPHICGPTTICIWGIESEREEVLNLRDKETWNEAIEAAAEFNDSCGYNLMAKEIRKLKK